MQSPGQKIYLATYTTNEALGMVGGLLILTNHNILSESKRISSNGWFNVMIQTKIRSAISSENSACVLQDSDDDTLAHDMVNINEDHKAREKCFLRTMLDRLKSKNGSCTPIFFENYPDFTKNNTKFCSISETSALLGTFTDVFLNECHPPCANIQYSHSMEPFHGALESISFMCGGPAIVLNFMFKMKVEVEKVYKLFVP